MVLCVLMLLHLFFTQSKISINTILLCTIFILDDQSNQNQLKQLRIPSRGIDDDELDNQESVVKIMVESPKDPPNSDFASTFPVPTVEIPSPFSSEIAPIQPSIDTTSTETQVIQIDDDNDDVNEPIDVNTPRDTTNIFYAYDETEANQINSSQQTIENASTNQSLSTHSNESTVDNSIEMHVTNDDEQSSTNDTLS